MNKNKTGTLGVIGGLGPVATAHFMELVIRMTRAECDQDHLDMIVYNIPSTPDRTAYILDHSKPNPLPKMIGIGRLLHRQNCTCIAIPCFTAHYFYEELCRSVDLPILNALQETALYLRQSGVRRVGIMATDGTIQSKLFHHELELQGIEPVEPSPQGQKDVMSLIYDDIKQNRPADMERFRRVRDELRSRGAEVIILGCTELSMIKRDYRIGGGFIDAMEVLAAASVRMCTGALSECADNLITPGERIGFSPNEKEDGWNEME